MFRILEESARQISTWDYDSLTEAKKDFTVLSEALKPGHKLKLIDLSGIDPDDMDPAAGNILLRYPPIPEKMQFESIIRNGGTGGNIKLTVPASVRDSMELGPTDKVRVTIERVY